MNSVHGSLRKISKEKRHKEGPAHQRLGGLVSVCIPTFNKEDYLLECLRSVHRQTYLKKEIIVVDDCSEDQTQDVLRFARQEGIKLTVHKLPVRRGTAWAQNIAYYLSSGEFIMNMDSDDVIHPDKILKQIEALKDEEVDFVGTNFTIFRDNADFPMTKDGGKWLKYDPEEIEESYLFNRVHCMCFGSIMWKAQVIEHIGGMTKEFIGTEDYEMCYRAFTKGFKGANIREPLYYYRSNETQRSKVFHGSSV